MGQTLSHGVYLPAEGERNCYSGLASNWNLLDTAIGDTAGKASATHTHGNISNDGKVGTTANLPLITGTGGVVQAGSFGNQANTFCEGNDSRLSDARTPVAHTHTKSDVTDLLNSNFIPSANNSYDLGSSSYQWNNLYAKNYYYNGVAWGLDKANTWSALNTYSNGQIRIKSLSQEIGVIPSSSVIQYLEFADKNDAQHGIVGLWDYTNGASEIQMYISDKFKNGTKDPTGTKESTILSFGFKADGSKFLTFSGQVDNSVIPRANNSYDLGSSSYQWKTLNGINPGALSLPDYSAEFDVSGQIVPPTGENQISINWGRNTFTPSVNGWLSVRIHKATSIEIYRSIRSSYCVASRVESVDDICVCSPVVAGVEYTIKIQATQFSSNYDHFRLSPCFGNV